MSTNANETVKGFKSLADIPARSVFSNVEDAQAYVANVMATPEAQDVVSVVHGLVQDAEGNSSVDWSKYEGQDIYVMKLQLKGGADMGAAGVRAFVVHPAPTLSDIILGASEPGNVQDWVAGLLETQVAHAIARPLRGIKDESGGLPPITAHDMAAVPVGLEDFTTTSRQSGGAKLFNKFVTNIIKHFAAKIPAFGRTRITKDTFRRCVESKHLASMLYPSFEELPNGKSVFVLGAEALLQLGEAGNYDTSLVEGWLANRDTVVFGDDEAFADDEDFDIDMDALISEISTN